MPVRIRGQDFRIRSDEHAGAARRAIARTVDETMERVERDRRGGLATTSRCSTALNLAREVVGARGGVGAPIDPARLRSLIELAEIGDRARAELSPLGAGRRGREASRCGRRSLARRSRGVSPRGRAQRAAASLAARGARRAAEFARAAALRSTRRSAASFRPARCSRRCGALASRGSCRDSRAARSACGARDDWDALAAGRFGILRARPTAGRDARTRRRGAAARGRIRPARLAARSRRRPLRPRVPARAREARGSSESATRSSGSCEVPHDSRDRRVDAIVTEHGWVWRCAGAT